MTTAEFDQWFDSYAEQLEDEYFVLPKMKQELIEMLKLKP